MAQIGTFTKKTDGSFEGKLQTLTINVKVTLTPETAGGESSPTHKVKANNIEIGAAWKKESREQRTYYSVKIDDPSFAQPVYATLTATDAAGEYILIWTRPGMAKHGKS